MPITVTVANKPSRYSTRELIGWCRKNFPPVNPANLFEQILTRYDFANRRFASMRALYDSIGRDISAEKFAVDPSAFQFKRNLFSQFKTVSIGTIDNLDVVRLSVKGENQEERDKLANEAELLLELARAGLRTVPLYTPVSEVRTSGTMYQVAIKGNMLDFKEHFTDRQQTNLVAALMGLKGDDTEKALESPKIRQDIEKKISCGILPSLTAIRTAHSDFLAIQIFLKEKYITDLQGIMEFGTGYFFIIDPLHIGPRAEAKAHDLGVIAYVDEAVAWLVQFQQFIATKTTAREEKIASLNSLDRF